MEGMKYLYELQLNWVITAICVVSSISLLIFGLAEIGGVPILKYSKFWKNNDGKQIKLSSRNGMLIAYTPAFLAGLVSFFVFPDEGVRFLLLRSALTLHFFKRIFEVLLIHKYSGGMDVHTAVAIGSCYGIATGTMIYSQHLIQGYGEPEIDLSYLGLVLFLVGISGNLYHHYLLSNLRSKEDKQYKIPKGGLFGFYLIGRSYATRRWYLSKFEDFPTHVKAVIPFVF
ncbi:3-oxo-5-alpha-steroid 4-dehydrogenase family protein [Euphorbia peplus]|nr:3-oxo-5-alpha-steroid 4-dehydrogenase family protein [Euphorbia peplus]